MKIVVASLMFSLLALPDASQGLFEVDVVNTSDGDLEITFIGHASLMMKFRSRIIYVDPFSRLADYAKLPKADLILITHEHQDHFDMSALDRIRAIDTIIVLTEKCAEKQSGGLVMRNGDSKAVLGIKIEAVPACNIVHKRENGQPFHPKGQGNGYVLTFGDKRIYIAGDTEIIPEMKALKDIGIAFLPMNLPYTMNPEMVADAAKAFKPRILYPYHYGDSDPSRLVTLLESHKNIEVRIRKMR